MIKVRRIPVDTARVKFISTGKSAARARYAELSDGSRKRVPDQQETDDQGRPGWTIDCLADDPDADRAAICSVKVYAYEVPDFRLGQEIKFAGLTALPYVLQGQTRVSLSFAAEGFELPAQQGKPQAA
jgi:hypothetical protein